MTRRLWLVRHGETEGQSSIRFHGRNDVALSDLGRAQVRALAPALAGIEPALIVHSPLVRAAESAAIVAAASGFARARLRADARLAELSFGDCEGLTAEEIEAAFPDFWAAHRRGEVDAFPNGESRRAFAARVTAAIAELAAGPANQDVLVVSHRGTVRQALRHLLAVPEGAADRLGVQLGSLSVARREGERPPAPWALEAFDLVLPPQR